MKFTKGVLNLVKIFHDTKQMDDEDYIAIEKGMDDWWIHIDDPEKTSSIDLMLKKFKKFQGQWFVLLGTLIAFIWAKKALLDMMYKKPSRDEDEDDD